MKKTSLVLAAALSCIAMSAAAGSSHGSQGSQGAAGGGDGAGIGVGIAAASSRTEIGIANTVRFGLTTGATTANGGLGFGGAATGIGGTGGSIGAGAVQVSAGNSTYRAAASSAFAPGAHGPVESCRLFMGAGASGVKGSLSGGLPIGNDQACVIEASHRIMNRMNAMKPDAFKYVDYLRPACKFEGLAETDECKALTRQQPAAAPIGMAYTPN
jgi:hypothetical protein